MRAKSISVLAIIVLFLISASIKGDTPSTKKNFFTPTAVGETANEKAEAIDYLNSFDDAAISETETSVFYSSTEPTKDFFTVDEMAEEDPKNSDTRLSYNVTYMKLLDIMYFDIGVIDADGNVVQTETLYGYPFVNKKGNKDVKIDVHGVLIYVSDLLNSETLETNSVIGSSVSNHLCVLADDYCGGGSSLYPILKISISICTFDQALGLAAAFIVVPDLFTDGPVPYLFYNAKIEMAKNDYQVNSMKAKPIGFINNQNSSTYSDWRFGLNIGGVGGSVSAGGCECIALYNLLYDCGANPDLATIIALVELSNADLFWGAFGANPVPNEVIDVYKDAILVVFNHLVVPLVQALIPVVAAVILQKYISEQPWWFQAVLYIHYGDAYLATAATLEAALITAVVGLNAFLDWYVAQLHDIGDVLKLLTPGHSVTSCSTFLLFEGNLSQKRQGIVSFWNNTNASGFVDFKGEAHTVYIRKNESTYSAYNVRCNGTECSCASIASIVGTNNGGNTSFVSNQFIWGYVAA